MRKREGGGGEREEREGKERGRKGRGGRENKNGKVTSIAHKVCVCVCAIRSKVHATNWYTGLRHHNTIQLV